MFENEELRVRICNKCDEKEKEKKITITEEDCQHCGGSGVVVTDWSEMGGSWSTPGPLTPTSYETCSFCNGTGKGSVTTFWRKASSN